jgi:hypothetical protein
MWQQIAVALPPPVPSAPIAHASSSGAGAAATVAKVYSVKQVVAIGFGLFGAGMGAGIGTTVAVSHLRRPPEAISRIPAAQPVVPAAIQPALVPTPAVIPNPEPPPPKMPQRVLRIERASPPTPAAPPKTAPAHEPTSDTDLAAERSLIAEARSALQRNAPVDALSALDAHAHQFPAGRLAEQREALRVSALLSSGDRPAAEKAAAAFEAKYPESLMKAAVQAALRSAP